MSLLVLVLGVGPMSRWKKTSVSYLIEQLGKVALTSLAIGVVLPTIILLQVSWVAIVAVTLAAWIVLSMLKDMANKTANKAARLAGLRALSLSYYGMQAAHFGMALMLIGVAFTSEFSEEKSVLLAPGESIDVGSYNFTFNDTQAITGPNYVGNQADFSVSKNGNELGNLNPERRIYLATGTPSTEMAIDAGFLRDLFVTLGEEKENSAWTMTIYVKPFIRWIWLGAIFMAFGGTVAAGDKRYRRVRERYLKREEQALATNLQVAS